MFSSSRRPLQGLVNRSLSQSKRPMSEWVAKNKIAKRKVAGIEVFRVLFYLAIPAGLAAYYTNPEVMQRLIVHYQWIRHPPEDPRAAAYLDGVMERRAKQSDAEKDFVEKELLEPDFRKVRQARLDRLEKEKEAAAKASE